MGADSWSPEDATTLIKLWANGDTAEQISIALNRRHSRNGVVSKASRLRLNGHPVEMRESTVNRGHEHRRAVYSHKTKPSLSKPFPFKAPIVKEKTEAIDLAHPSNEPEAIGPLESFPPARSCLWMRGDIRTPGWRFCGHPVGTGNYCSHHAARVFNKPYAARP